MLNPRVGDVLVSGSHRQKVLAVVGDIVALSWAGEEHFDKLSDWCTKTEIRNSGWTIEEPAKPEYPEEGAEVWLVLDAKPYFINGYTGGWGREIALNGWYRSKEECEDAIKKISAFVKGGLR